MISDYNAIPIEETHGQPRVSKGYFYLIDAHRRSRLADGGTKE
jgi:hypothetical protein